jgi:hypothetical protein
MEEDRLVLCACPDAKVVNQILNMGEEKGVLIACLLWRWWSHRNKLNAKDKTGGQESIVKQIRFWAAESGNFFKKVPLEKIPALSAGWKAPTGNCLKINVDGAFDAARRTGGWGFVIRDSYGDIRGSGAGVLHHVASAAQAEALACEEAARAAADWGMTNVTFESDAQNLVRAMKGSDFDRTPEGVIYKDLRLYVQLHFNSY